MPVALGSRSTQLRGAFGGLEGRMLRRGDVLRAGAAGLPASALPAAGLGALPPHRALPLGDDAPDTVAVRVVPAKDYPAFDAPSRARLWETAWRITPESNRLGYRLDGPPLALTEPLELRSHGIVPGIVQVPSGGRPIIQLADAATMGGYPTIGAVIEADLWRLGQARPGSALRFIEATYEDGLRARADNAAYLTALAAAVAERAT